MERLLISASLVRSKKLCHFLRFTVEESLRGHGSELKEYSLGVAVFQRGREFDPGADPIMRVQARRLRSKLAEYYRTEGKSEPVAIEYPVGSYAPVFRNRTEPEATAPRIPSAELPLLERDLLKPIVVLPFLAIGGESPADFSDGLTEELIHAVSIMPELRVISRTSSAQFKAGAEDARRIGERLGVRAIIEGSVRLEGDRVRVQVQLIDAATGVNSWSGVYQQAIDGVLATQEEIARRISVALRSQLCGRAPADKQPMLIPANPEAQNLCWKGRFFLSKHSAEATSKAIECFEQAKAIDDGYAAACAGLADGYLLSVMLGLGPPNLLFPKLKAMAAEALRLDPGCVEAHSAMAAASALYDWNFGAAGNEFRALLATHPSAATARYLYSVATLLPRHETEPAIQQLRLALEFDPLSAATHTGLAMALHLAGRQSEAVEQCRRALDLESAFFPAWQLLGVISEAQSQWDEASRAFHSAAAAMGGDRGQMVLRAALGYLCARSGRAEEAHRYAGELREMAERMYVPALEIAGIYAALRKFPAASHWLEKAMRDRDPGIVWLPVDRRFLAMHGDSRYQDLIRTPGARRKRSELFAS